MHALFLVTMISTSWFASTPLATAAAAKKNVSLKIDAKIGDQSMSSSLVLNLGEHGTLTKKIDATSFYTIEVIPTEPESRIILLEFKISQTLNGKFTLLSSPRITTQDGLAADLEQKSGKLGTPSIQLSAIPTLQ